MPPILSWNHGSRGTTHLWRIDESHDYFLTKLTDSGIDLQVIDGWHPERQREWLAGRHLIQEYINHPLLNLQISDQTGKPYFPGVGDYFSLSHSGRYVALACSSVFVGCDIQIYSKTLERIQRKFCSPSEIEQVRQSVQSIDPLHLIWTAKEAMYKALGQRGVRFREDITLDLDKEAGEILHGGMSHQFDVHHYQLHELTVALSWIHID
ncbi:MAG: 4'-phosphopantetheinyl transferase superfamily protein [Bacteroidota bacterium]